MNSDVEKICEFAELLLQEFQHPAKQFDVFSVIEEITDRAIPNSIKVILGDEAEEMLNVFGAWTFSTMFQLRLEYSEMSTSHANNPSFFNMLKVSDEFDLPSDGSLLYQGESGYPGRYDLEDEIINLKYLVPIAKSSHANLLLNLDSDVPGELLGCHYGTYFYVYAPTVEEHLLDIVEGLRAGRYPVEDGYIGIGDTWLERMKSKLSLIHI